MPDAPLYPPTFRPPDVPLGTLEFLVRCAQNPLATIPIAAYREPAAAVTARHTRAIWLSDPDDIERVLLGEAANFRKTDIEKRLFARVIGNGVLTAEGADWRWQRRVLASLFRPAEVLNYVTEMSAAAEAQIDRWREHGRAASAGPTLTRPIDHDMTEATYDVIVRTMLYGGRPADIDAVMTSGQRYLSGSPWVLAYGMLNVPAWLPHPASWKLRRAAREFRASVASIIEDRRKRGGETGDLLGRLLAARNPDTDAPLGTPLLVDNLATLLEAGHETTAKALTWALYLIARAPDWQQQIRDEAHTVAGDGPLRSEHLEHLDVTEHVIKEVLRLYPPAPVMSRAPIMPVEVAGYRLEPGDPIFIPIYAVHRHALLWDDPDRFDPDRFRPDREAHLKRTQYMPFGAGPRICLGAAFSMIEAKVLLASFVRAARFEWDGHHLPEPISRVTLHPKGGMPLRVTLL